MEKILITGACGQLGTELTLALAWHYGKDSVLASDILPEPPQHLTVPYTQLDVLDAEHLRMLVHHSGVTQIYHLAAVLSATGEKYPLSGWDLNMQGLLNVLEVARTNKLRVFWPSSIAVFGAHLNTAFTPQHSLLEPATVYGISKAAGELWCKYYFERYGVDVRSLRYPGLISHSAPPGGGTTDYAVDIFLHAAKNEVYTCYLRDNTVLPMLYMPDAIRATLELMEAEPEKLRVRTSYNLHGLSFTPKELSKAIRKRLPDFAVSYAPDERQRIADTWPGGIDDHYARSDWGWNARFDLDALCDDMLNNLIPQYELPRKAIVQ